MALYVGHRDSIKLVVIIKIYIHILITYIFILELAVVVENQIRLLTSNGTLVDTKDQPFSSLKALAYDNIRDQFIVSDMNLMNDTIYTVQIDEHTTDPIIQGVPGDVQVKTIKKYISSNKYIALINPFRNIVEFSTLAVLFFYENFLHHSLSLYQ